MFYYECWNRKGKEERGRGVGGNFKSGRIPVISRHWLCYAFSNVNLFDSLSMVRTVVDSKVVVNMYKFARICLVVVSKIKLKWLGIHTDWTSEFVAQWQHALHSGQK